MKLIRRVELLDKLRERFNTEDLTKETFVLAEVVIPVTNIDSVAEETKIDTKIVTTTGVVDRFTVPKGKKWIVSDGKSKRQYDKVISTIPVTEFIGMLDSVPALEFLTVEENVVFYPGSVTSTHLVDSIFGNLSIFENII